MATLTGPDGGTWVRTTGRIRCSLCRRLVEGGWRYFIGVVSHMDVCDDCAEKPEAVAA